MEVEILKKEAYTDSIWAYGTLGVLVLEHAQTTVQYLVLVTGCQSVGKIQDAEVFKLTQATFVPLSQKARMELVQDVGNSSPQGSSSSLIPPSGQTLTFLLVPRSKALTSPTFIGECVYMCSEVSE